MKCPKCNAGRTRVTETILQQDNRVMRWRRCRECSHTFPTFELTARDLTKAIGR